MKDAVFGRSRATLKDSRFQSAHAQDKFDRYARAEDGIFETAANLESWPEILPHYRYIRFLERGPDRNVVVMAAERSGIPISWTRNKSSTANESKFDLFI